MLMQVWITSYHGFSREATGLFVDHSDEAAQGTRSSCDFGRKVLS